MGKKPIHAKPLSEEQKQAIFQPPEITDPVKQALSILRINDSTEDEADTLLKSYVTGFLRENGLRFRVTSAIFWRRILYAFVYALLLFLVFTYYCLYHTGSGISTSGFTAW